MPITPLGSGFIFPTPFVVPLAWVSQKQADYSAACDADNDGRIDMVDFAILAGHWMED